MSDLEKRLAAIEASITCCEDCAKDWSREYASTLLAMVRRAVEALTQVAGTYTNDVQRVAEADEPAAALTAHATLVDLARLLGEGERG